MDEFFACFAELEDPRDDNGGDVLRGLDVQRHPY